MTGISLEPAEQTTCTICGWRGLYGVPAAFKSCPKCDSPLEETIAGEVGSPGKGPTTEDGAPSPKCPACGLQLYPPPVGMSPSDPCPSCGTEYGYRPRMARTTPPTTDPEVWQSEPTPEQMNTIESRGLPRLSVSGLPCDCCDATIAVEVRIRLGIDDWETYGSANLLFAVADACQGYKLSRETVVILEFAEHGGPRPMVVPEFFLSWFARDILDLSRKCKVRIERRPTATREGEGDDK